MAATQTKPAPINILCIDDEVFILRSLKRTFMHLPYNFRYVSNSTEALELAGKQEFTLVICDFLMPDIKGIQILEKVKESFPQCRRMLLTGRPDFNGEALSDQVNLIHQYLEKPWEQESLINVIEAQLKIYRENKA